VQFSLGINYWPRRTAMAMWERFDLGEITEDLERIAGFGLDAVRFFLRWSDFQPQPNRVDTAMLRRLVSVADAIGERGLRAMPTLFCGHMSGVNWLPSWALDPAVPAGRFRTITESGESPYGAANTYTGMLLAAQRLHAREVGRALRDHPAVVAWDLGNEFSNVAEPASASEAAEWSKYLTDDLERFSGRPVTGGLHGEDLTRDRKIRPSSIAEPWAFATMHGYSVYSDFARGRLDAHVVPFLAQLTASFARKPVLFSEFGNPTCPPGRISPYDRVPLPDDPPLPPVDDTTHASYACLTEEEMATYARAVIDRLHADGRLGAYWWCWADYADELKDEPPFDRAPHERSFGLIRADGSPKPVARMLASIAKEGRTVRESADPVMFEPAYYAGLPRTTGDAYARYREYSA
jgi:endo-1,4-beta-mannosidase